MHDDTFLCSTPYEEGKSLTLNVTKNVPSNKHTIKLQILRSIQPNTLSCVMEVQVLADSTKYAKHSILKLYDWRYATQLRQDNRVGRWTPYHEDTYRTFVEESGAATFISALEHDSIDDQSWDTARDETFLFDYYRNLHSCEVEAYSRLKDLQGKSVPRFGSTYFPPKTPFSKFETYYLSLSSNIALTILRNTHINRLGSVSVMRQFVLST